MPPLVNTTSGMYANSPSMLSFMSFGVMVWKAGNSLPVERT